MLNEHRVSSHARKGNISRGIPYKFAQANQVLMYFSVHIWLSFHFQLHGKIYITSSESNLPNPKVCGSPQPCSWAAGTRGSLTRCHRGALFGEAALNQGLFSGAAPPQSFLLGGREQLGNVLQTGTEVSLQPNRTCKGCLRQQ